MDYDIADAIDDEAVNVTLSGGMATEYDANGEALPTQSAPVNIRAVIQPMRGNQLQDLPEGIRTSAGWLCWSRRALQLDQTITHKGIVYRILYTWPRPEGGFTRAALGRVTT